MSTYKTTESDKILDNETGQNPQVNDVGRDGYRLHDKGHMEVQVAVAAGEYFSTLATLLDHIANESTDKCEHPELHVLVNDLLYLQKYYTIVKRDKPDLRS